MNEVGVGTSGPPDRGERDPPLPLDKPHQQED